MPLMYLKMFQIIHQMDQAVLQTDRIIYQTIISKIIQ